MQNKAVSFVTISPREDGIVLVTYNYSISEVEESIRQADGLISQLDELFGQSDYQEELLLADLSKLDDTVVMSQGLRVKYSDFLRSHPNLKVAVVGLDLNASPYSKFVQMLLVSIVHNIKLFSTESEALEWLKK